VDLSRLQFAITAMYHFLFVPLTLGMSFLATRSTTEEVKGLKDLLAGHESRISSGIIAYEALSKMRAGDKSAAVKRSFDEHKHDVMWLESQHCLGYDDDRAGTASGGR
jgi:cytochrome bd-type quinol oxidase subunit 1